MLEALAVLLGAVLAVAIVQLAVIPFTFGIALYKVAIQKKWHQSDFFYLRRLERYFITEMGGEP